MKKVGYVVPKHENPSQQLQLINTDQITGSPLLCCRRGEKIEHYPSHHSMLEHHYNCLAYSSVDCKMVYAAIEAIYSFT